MSLSLRSFHLLFIAASVALSAMVAVWGIRSWRSTGETGDLALGAFFLVVGILLVLYGFKVRKKLRDLDPED